MLLQISGSPEVPTHAHEGSMLRKDMRRSCTLTAGCMSCSERQEVKMKAEL